jgi:xanthosine utilization system XapX-like protein
LDNEKTLTKDSKIVQVCNKIIKREQVSNEDRQKAQETIKMLATKRDPQSLFELAQLIGFLVDDKFMQTTNYLNEIADVRPVKDGDKASFKMQRGTISALWQARGSTAERTMIGTEYSSIEADEISIAPAIELEQLQNGQIDFTSLVSDANIAMEYALLKKIETVIEAYWDDLGSPWYASGNGVTPAIDPIIAAVGRLGSPVILGDIALIQKFVNLTGFNGNVPDAIAIEYNQTGVIGTYKGARLVQLVNPLFNDTDMTTTWLDKGYAYILPAGAATSSRPLKVVFEGSMGTYETRYAQSRILEIAMYKKVGVGLASIRYGAGFYSDTSL